MILSTAIELIVIGLVVWQLIVVRRSIRADRDKAATTSREIGRSMDDEKHAEPR